MIDIDIEQQRQEAQDETTSPKRLRELAFSDDSSTRRSVANNPNTPTETLLSLSDEFPQEVLNNDVIFLILMENSSLFSCPILPLAPLALDDFRKVMCMSTVLLISLGWTLTQAKDYLMQTYGKKSRLVLTD